MILRRDKNLTCRVIELGLLERLLITDYRHKAKSCQNADNCNRYQHLCQRKSAPEFIPGSPLYSNVIRPFFSMILMIRKIIYSHVLSSSM